MAKDHADWLVRHERPRDWTLERYLLSDPGTTAEQEAITALEAELIEERERREELERQLREQAAQLRALRERIEVADPDAPPSADEPPQSRPARASRPIALRPRDEAAGPGYWLRRCEGFRVETRSGRLGTVDAVRFGRRLDRPDALVVAIGHRWRRRLLQVPADEVEEISPDEKRVALATDPRESLPPSDRRRASSLLAPAPVAASLAVLLAAAAVLLLLLLRPGGAQQQQHRAKALASSRHVPTRARPARSVRQPVLLPVALRGIGAWDPAGDRREHDEDAPLAVDGNPVTYWRTETYADGLDKPGVGLLLDAGRPLALRRLTFTTDTPGYTARIEAATSPDGPFRAIAGAKMVLPATTFALHGSAVRYYLVWITRLDHVAHINEAHALRWSGRAR